MESTKNFKNIKDYLHHWDLFFKEWKKDKKGTFNKDIVWKNRKGKGKTELEYDVLPQPYLGNIHDHSVITLNLNPSRSKKNKENIEFEENYLPKFKEKENYYEYAESFPTYDTHPFWKKQNDWIDRIFEKLGKEKPSKNPEPLKPFAIEICPWGSQSFQKLDIVDEDEIVEYMDNYVFGVIEKVITNSRLKMVLSVGKAYYDIFQKSEFENLEEISSKPIQREVFKFSNDKYKTHLDLSLSENNKYIEEKISKIPYNWPIKFVQRSFSIWEKDGILYFNTYASGSNSPPGDHFDEIQNDLIKRHLQKKLIIK